MNTFGQHLRLSLFGESHGAAIGCVLDGLPPGLAIDLDRVRAFMARRAPGSSNLATARKEADAFEILSGWFENRTTGTPLAAIIRNTSQHSKDYGELKDKMRPGHADWTGHVKYKGFNDYRGGGHFSGRLTAPLVFAGAVAAQMLEAKGISIGAHALEIAGVRDKKFHPLGEEESVLAGLKEMKLPVLDRAAGEEMEAAILAAKNEGDSVGGVVECIAQGLPAGLGDPFFGSVESRLSQMLFSIPAVKGVEFGDGFDLARMKGSGANDPMHFENGAVVSDTNHNGGILGGITSGAPLLFRVAVKPTASIAKEQQTVNIATGETTTLSIRGRHDPCIVPRAVPVVEAACAFVMADLMAER